MDREQYRTEYLQSEHWKTVRLGALERAGHHCQVCNAAKSLDVHHRTYERIGHELDGDLTVLCRKCHDIFHGASKVKKSGHRKRAPGELRYIDGELKQQVLALLRNDDLTSRQIGAALAVPGSLIGTCLVRCRRQGLVGKSGKEWFMSGEEHLRSTA